jgi:diketogulonate reductase-like aldo/keto reductase
MSQDPWKKAVMPLLAFGTWQLHGKHGYDTIRTALDAGFRHIDTATMYGNEDIVGRAIRDSGIPREDIFITTKLPPERFGRAQEQLDRSRSLLGVDYVDLWLVHWPPANGSSLEIWGYFIRAWDFYQARSIGVSNHSLAQIDELDRLTHLKPHVNQIRMGWTGFSSEPRLVANFTWHRDAGVVLFGHSVLSRSDLADPALVEIAEAHNVQPAQVVLRWFLEHDAGAVFKSTDPEHIKTNAAVFDFRLTADEVTRLDELV